MIYEVFEVHFLNKNLFEFLFKKKKKKFCEWKRKLRQLIKISKVERIFLFEFEIKGD